jgi:hypothetical protein
VFVGTVKNFVDTTAAVSVDEPFEGVAKNAKEVAVGNPEKWLEVGKQYLFDTSRGGDGLLYPRMCGQTAEISDPFLEKVLEFLRARAHGKTSTSLSVYVTDQYKPLSGATVSLLSGGQRRTGSTDEKGIAEFDAIAAGHYHVLASKDHYHPEEDRPEETFTDVLSGTCPHKMVGLAAEAGLSGHLLDFQGNPVASLRLYLILMPENSVDSGSRPSGVIPTTKSLDDGTFSFDSVSPGRYLIALDPYHFNEAKFPRTFYPGVRETLAAAPVEVKLGETTGDVVFRLPDYGPSREITLCVLDEKGNLVANSIISSLNKLKTESAKLGEKLLTDQSGCVRTSGFASVNYMVQATLPPTPRPTNLLDLLRQTRYSEELTIPAGDNLPVHQILVLKPPASSISPKSEFR